MKLPTYEYLKQYAARTTNINDNFATGIAEEIYYLNYKYYVVTFINNIPTIHEKSL